MIISFATKAAMKAAQTGKVEASPNRSKWIQAGFIPQIRITWAQPMLRPGWWSIQLAVTQQAYPF